MPFALALSLLLVAAAQEPGPSTSPVPAPATAGTPSPAQRQAMRAMRDACAVDTQKLCASTQPGGGRLMQCYREHAAELTPGCRESLMQMRRSRRAGA